MNMKSFRLNHPWVQNLVAGLIVGLGPGIYAAITILGAGGGRASAAKMANIANSTLYAVYFVLGLLSGSVVTAIGPRNTFLLGTLGYPVYLGGLWYYSNTGHLWYPIFGGAVLGVTACLLWTAAGYIAFSYALENQKGHFISMQWGLLSLISTIASLVAFGINYHASMAECPTAVYVVFTCLMASAFLVAYFGIVPSSKVRRSDGTALAHYPYDGFWPELKAQAELFKDWRMIALIVPMFGSEVAVIVFSILNALFFNIRTRSLNSVMFTVMQGVGAFFISVLLDNRRFGSRRARGMISLAVMGSVILAGWIGATVWVHKHPYDPLNPTDWDWTDGEFAGFFILNLIFGANMCIYQTVVQWIIASFSNEPHRLARYAGCAKGCLAGGLACSFGVEAAGLSQNKVIAFNFTFQAVGLVCMFAVCWTSVTPTMYFKEENVIPPVMLQVEKGGEEGTVVVQGVDPEVTTTDISKIPGVVKDEATREVSA